MCRFRTFYEAHDIEITERITVKLGNSRMLCREIRTARDHVVLLLSRCKAVGDSLSWIVA